MRTGYALEGLQSTQLYTLRNMCTENVKLRPVFSGMNSSQGKTSTWPSLPSLAQFRYSLLLKRAEAVAAAEIQNCTGGAQSAL
jgi:hypothetical protein